MGARTILERPFVRFGREVCSDLAAALRREWLVTNGLGGYASGTVAGVATRRYHGLLVASLAPPTARTVLVAGAVEWVLYRGKRYPLSTHTYEDGTVDPHGYRHIQSFALDGVLPVWTFALGDALLERRVWMEQGENTTHVRYVLVRGVTPLVTYRDFHSLGIDHRWRPEVEATGQRVLVQPFQGAVPYRLLGSRTRFEAGADWYWGLHHAEEMARGLDDREDLYVPGTFAVTLDPGEVWSLTLTTEARDAQAEPETAYRKARARQSELLRRAGVERGSSVEQQLTLAADQFIVDRRAGDGSPAGRTVIAGYHWFNDWGRDTMIALPGLTLATGRSEDAAGILRAFGRYVRDGLLPNNFPDTAGADPEYNTADASLWYLWAARLYGRATGDRALTDELLPTLERIVERYTAGTRYGIGVDPADGLLRAGEPGHQITWMDAKIGDWVVTPRIGKPVELNALWYNALHTLAELLAERGEPRAAAYSLQAHRVAKSFCARFWDPTREYLADVVDGPEGDDWTLRPNQIFALSLPFPLLSGGPAAAVLDAVGRELLTGYGLRSLAAGDPAYRGDYGGDAVRRDSGYHQGPVWAWLLGPYAEAHYRVHGDRAAARALLEPIADHLRDAGLGSVSEILEGDPPHLPRGCVAQAWSVAETLRVWREVSHE